MITNRAVTALLLIAALAVVASPAAAQYMYLDSNGNGVHDPGDRLGPIGVPTTVDVWLDTNHNRDGSLATCDVDPTMSLPLNDYFINLQAAGGSVSYSGFVTHFGNPPIGEFNPGDGIRYANGLVGIFSLLSPGLHRLATLTITGTGGAPDVSIVDRVNGVADITMFSPGNSGCLGNDFDNVYKLTGPAGGSDWTDVDGLDRFIIDEGTPVLAAIGNKTVNEGECLTFTATATSPNGNPVTFSLTGQPPVGASITTAGQFNWCPTEAQGPGVYPITVTVTDNGTGNLSDSETIQVTVSEVNVAPVLTAIGNKTVAAGNTLAFTATATDGDLPANTLTFSLDPGTPVGVAITAGGNFTWTPTINQAPGNYPITIRVTDNGVPVLSDAKSFAVFVSQGETGPPIVTNPGNKTVNEGECLNFTIAATSPGGNPLTFALGAGSPSGASISSFGGQFIWCPTEAQGPGNYAITVNVSDGFLTTSTIFTVTVLEVNLAPVLNPIGNKTGALGTLLTFTATATDADLPANTRTFSLDPGAPAGATIGAASGVFSWTLNASGTFPVTIRVTDNGTPPLSDSETILITPCLGCGITPPVLGAIGNKTVNELALLSFTATATDADPAQTLTFTLGAGNPAGSAITPGGAFTWTPTEAQGPGVFPITVIVTDDGFGNLSDSETIQVTVNEVNLAPVLQPIGNKVTCPGHTITFTASATDADIPANTLTCSMDAGGPPGAMFNPATCTFSWTPSSSGTFVATIRVTDNGTPPLSDAEVVTIVVGLSPGSCPGPVLDPIANMTVDEGLIATQAISGSDPDNAPLTFTKTAGPLLMTVTTTGPTTGNIRLEPGFADAGSYSGTVRASNGTAFDQRTFTINVTNICRPPLADAGGPYAGTTGVAIQFNGGGSADPDGDALTYIWSFGDGATGSGATPNHAYATPGTYLVALTVADACGLTDDDTTTATISTCLTAFFYATGNKFAMINLASGKPSECLQVEPVLGAFAIEDVDLASIVLRSPNTGSVTEIHALGSKTSVGSDRNGNGIDEITACFSKDDLRLLFSNLSATQTVEVTMEGDLVEGGKFCTTQGLSVKADHGGGGTLAASISPNPLNPSAVLSFATQERGPVLVQLFDVRGRLLRTLRDESDAAAGYHDVRIDGTDANGTRLSSGVYYLRIRAGIEEERKAITILK